MAKSFVARSRAIQAKISAQSPQHIELRVAPLPLLAPRVSTSESLNSTAILETKRLMPSRLFEFYESSRRGIDDQIAAARIGSRWRRRFCRFKNNASLFEPAERQFE